MAAKPGIAKLAKVRKAKSDKKPFKKVVAKTKKVAKKIGQADQIKKTKLSKDKEALKKAKKKLSQIKSKITHKPLQKIAKTTLDSSSRKKLKQRDLKGTPSSAKTLVTSKSETKPEAYGLESATKSPQQKKKETFYDAVEGAFHDEQVVLTNAEGKQFCHHRECDQVATTDIYCRHHYILLWKLIQRKKRILEGDKLKQFIQEIAARYPDKFLDMIRKNLSTERDFTATLQELEITRISDSASDYQDSHKDLHLEDDHLQFPDERSET